ncbi:LOW QUALITY PROTEIN: sialic acid-binding Ig-like lectin 6 [Onychostoma macrolepis]|uniref:LOW QUALITY PROTEIN: sialic acid-binding Ig-like lectin 6 n=1 Tax=Onychostoma macrolepis TaxID=369639 RepID=UPI00272BAF33|nr:LOW QUALITY PROTEIN: sialic acid-binding Ig-like lectin 6 [Onychostoma macrolepis]
MLQTLLFILTAVQMTVSFDPDDPTDIYSINVENRPLTGEASLCIRVFFFFTVPQSVSDPIRRTWFKGDPQNPAVEVPHFSTNVVFPHNKRECNFLLKNLVQGESDGEYRLKLQWGEGNVYIFPQTVNITVKELTQKPTINVPLLTEGEKAEISCKVPGYCMNPTTNIVWTGIEPDEVKRITSRVIGRDEVFSTLTFHPRLEHHNTNLTCRVIFQENIQTESTVILKAQYAPKILNSSRCFVWSDELSCMCVSSGVPLPQISWPILNGTTKHCSAISTENIISISNISIPGFRNINATVECVSVNLIGTTKMEIQVHYHGEKPQEISCSLSTPWILFTLSFVLNVIIASCLIVVVVWRREKCMKPKDDDHVYMTAMKREESVYETIKMFRWRRVWALALWQRPESSHRTIHPRCIVIYT